MTLTAQQHQGLHGEGYIFAMACTAGLLTSRPILDIDGVDWLIGGPGPLGTARSPKIEVQVKTAWMTLAEQELFTDAPDTPATTTVRVPIRNLLTPESLRALVAGEAELGEPT